MRKSQVSALCDDQQNEKCRNNDRGNEPAHDVTFIVAAESIVNWLRHHVHMGTIISSGNTTAHREVWHPFRIKLAMPP